METKTAQHTPTPWRLSSEIHGHLILESEGDVFTGPLETNRVDVAFIVRAVNSHSSLVASLREMVNSCETVKVDSPLYFACRRALDALDKAEGR